MNKNDFSNQNILHNPLLNKGTAFSLIERNELNLHGKIPPIIETLDEQVKRAYLQYKLYPNPLLQNIFLHELHNTNVVLFYKLLQTHFAELLPILYTPNVAHSVTNFSTIYNRPEGLYLSYLQEKHLEHILVNYLDEMQQYRKKTNLNLYNIDLIVVTDGEGVLGIGDQGIGSVQIVVAKAMLYTIFAQIHPARILPIVLDVGTNNQKLLDDPLYLGWRHKRLEQQQYNEFIHKFVTVIQKYCPQSFLHWEDFGRDNAHNILQKYKTTLPNFNDDIQGTAVVTISAILTALRLTKQTWDNQRIVIFGAGTAGIGIAQQLVKTMQQFGMNADEIYHKLWLIDRNGLITELTPNITDAQQPFKRTFNTQKLEEKTTSNEHIFSKLATWQIENPKNISLYEVVKNLAPTILIGCSTQHNAFTQEIIQTMSRLNPHPIILPLSNPDTKCEAQPQDLLAWTNGTALIATGSPFPPVNYANQTVIIPQCNNALAFPAIGLGMLTAKAKLLTDEMLWTATQTLTDATLVYNQRHSTQLLLLPLTNAYQEKISEKIAYAIALQASKAGLSDCINDNTNITELIQKNMWNVAYD